MAEYISSDDISKIIDSGRAERSEELEGALTAKYPHAEDVEPEPKPKRKPAAKKPEAAPGYVVVTSSDTWGRLALRTGVDAGELAAANGMTCRSLLTAGTRLRLP